jgi:hypothetical protein
MAQDDTEHAETLAMIAIAQKGDPRRLLEAIAEVACQLEIRATRRRRSKVLSPSC